MLSAEYQEIIPSPSSWGWKGYNEVWLNGSNDWIYPYIHSMAEQMIQLSSRFPNSSGIQEKALNQLARELLLAQSSDWPFMMKTNICCNDAIRRIKDHISGFDKIYTMIKEDNIDEGWIQKRFLK